MVIHQRNHLRLESLRDTATALDETIKTTLKVLADTRKEIEAISPETSFSEPRRTVKIDDVLAYAKFISKTTVPPTFRPSAQATNTTGEKSTNIGTPKAGQGVGGIDKETQLASEITTPVQDELALNSTFTTNNSSGTKGTNGSSTIVGLDVLPEQDRTWLEPAATLPFEPWPSHEVISAGALAAIQRMVEAGQDPAAVLSQEEQAAADARRLEEEAIERREQAERERRRREAFDAPQRRPTVADGLSSDIGGFNPDDL